MPKIDDNRKSLCTAADNQLFAKSFYNADGVPQKRLRRHLL